MFEITRPMLASACKDLEALTFPQLATPKLDGLRCLVVNRQALTRKFKAIPNKHVRAMLEAHIPNGFDGELMVVSGRNEKGQVLGYGTFNEAQSAIMSEDGEPDFRFLVFDAADDLPYKERIEVLKEWVPPLEIAPHFKALLPITLNSIEELREYEARCLKAGYEGVMIRTPESPYKNGRSTVKQGWLLKIKQFADDEAEVIGYVERQHNENELEKDELGYAKRSTKQEGMVGANTLGALQARLKDGREFQVGTGFDDAQRKHIWENQENYLGQTFTFIHQPHGAKDLPRFPVFKGWRDPRDTGEPSASDSVENQTAA